MTLSPPASSAPLQAGAVPGVSTAHLGLSCIVRCPWQEIDAGVGFSHEGCLASSPPTPEGERAAFYAVFVERSNGSSSNYHHGNYRIASSTECVQKRLGESPQDASPPLGTDSGEQAFRVWLG